MAKKTKEVVEQPATVKAFLPVKHANGNVSIVSVQVPSDAVTTEETRPLHPIVACDSLFRLVWDIIWVSK